MPVSATFLELKEKIQKELNVEVDRQRLWYKTRELKDHELIEDYHFHQYATVNLTVRPLPEEPKVHVLVKHNGADGYVRVRESDKVYKLRRKVEKYWGIPSDQHFTLRRFSKQMVDDHPLYAYYINEGSEVQLSVSIDPR